jgi:hypothetical protein
MFRLKFWKRDRPLNLPQLALLLVAITGGLVVMMLLMPT